MEDLEIGRRLENGRNPRAVLIAGPTASGKSAFALRLAERENGVIVNADSMQVYAELAILSARPTPEEEARVPHRLYGQVPASTRFSVAAWREEVARILAEIWNEGRLPILVGGTGLYFKALTEGLSAVPPIPEALRLELDRAANEEGVPALHARLAGLDPDAALRLAPNDRTRVLRALEVVLATGRTLAAFQAEPALPPLIAPEDAARIVLEPDRAVLYDRINKRLDAMVEAGALEEARALLALGLDPNLPAMKAIGVTEFGGYLAGKVSLDAAIVEAKMQTRRYAKRQGTWFRNQMGDWGRVG
ncbi:tRNA (adenosine(37)-N6)-dimethylallyltransferase MiaA [Kaistia algarum]|uniref:tRNA (adenosine(37)-N6)-dimethylallyltransferase MiaA n=1 Tax=Kaistia algarum TaxID=2083279 RepID=UPI0022521284|nr:tRNA (adenosine(37)-N6)-dimethylallyltransferase MiaA [Kaistia algarum]MCX5515993.1 tRNA (adenosine(37)-N6)-dimethylallyltransferase MiaA [Kaistia algarum]